MNIKAVLCDLDGTLIDYYGVYGKETPHLIQRLQEKNISFALATGNGYFGVAERIVQELALSPLHIVHGGGMIINWKTKETPLFKPISKKSTKLIVAYFNSAQCAFSLETRTGPYMTHVVQTSAYPQEIIKYFSVKTIPSEVLKILVLASVNHMTETDIDSHIKNISQLCMDVELMKFAYRAHFGLDITSKNATKHTAVLEYARILGISPSEIVAIGDGHNDHPLFTACGYRIAMDNAPDALKAIANKIVPRSEDDGMRVALEHVLTLSNGTMGKWKIT